MVHIKRVELSHFKSFGGTTSIPLLPGFTVVSGPNGSGKSNILDALLFCLGLATSKGMRAERLPDLVNHNQATNRNSAEAKVSVTFDLSDEESARIGDTSSSPSSVEDNLLPQSHREWTITRRLRVNREGNYASIYYINGETCTVTELHEQLNRLRIYPEGYNVVLQGDVTRIITMNHRERREIIDELAGVAEFDRKIGQTKETLEEVREREERCRIIEQELVSSLERLASDRLKAEKYQKLKAQIHEKQQWESVLVWQVLQQQYELLQGQITATEISQTELSQALNSLTSQISQGRTELELLNGRVKELGEEEQLSFASQLATQKAKRHQLQQRQQELATLASATQSDTSRITQEIAQHQQTLAQLQDETTILEQQTIPPLLSQRNEVRETLSKMREEANAIAAASEAWVQEQTSLSHKIATLQENLNPQRTEQAQLRERYQQLEKICSEQRERWETTEREIDNKTAAAQNLSQKVSQSQETIKTLAQQLSIAEHDRVLQQDTQKRLLKEQRDKQRELDKLEATQQAQQEAQGTYATQVILQSDLPGVCGLVAHLGAVELYHQLALEVAAGPRLGYLVVEDDSIAAAGIELLKQKRVGRATFLPLNKIQSPRIIEVSNLRSARGFVDLAVNLVTSHPRYSKIFAYVFGNTVIFETLNDARPYLSQYRIVTLDGDILDVSGAMTGGVKPIRSSVHFGNPSIKESVEVISLKKRLADLENILIHTEELIAQKTSFVKQLSQDLTEVRQEGREEQLQWEQLQKDIQRLTAEKEDLSRQLERNIGESEQAKNRLEELAVSLPFLETQLQQEQASLAKLEEAQTHSEWLKIQGLIKLQETNLQNQEESLMRENKKLNELQNQGQLIAEKIRDFQQRLAELEKQKGELDRQKLDLQNQIIKIDDKIRETEVVLQQLLEKLGEAKQQRDRAEINLRNQQNEQQKTSWELQKLQEIQQERRHSLQSLSEQIETQKSELPVALPEVSILDKEPEKSLSEQLEILQKEIRAGQKRLEAMEPVNMLALEEYERTQARVQELSNKLATLEGERTELLLRVENFTTLRFRAFREAFDAVNENFKSIFATLSEGDGYLELEDAENIFNGGLNLIAHPKGKPVQRLSSMSGGEKSLTALSFIFALQRYRPSPFYAFDEVDMFLDGSNVERLSRMIKNQAEQAQFIVVSLRRPMIEAAERTIGVTQARGAHTQVLGIKL